MVFVRIYGNLLSNSPRAPEVVGIEATIGCPLATLPSKEIYSPLLIHIASKAFIPEDQFTHALCVFRFLSFSIFRLGSFIVIVIDDVPDWDVKCKSFLPVRVSHPEFFPFIQVN